MNIQECDILLKLMENPFSTQRELAERSGHSLGIVNRTIKVLADGGYINEDMQVTWTAKKMVKGYSPQNAVILAAGFGMRMVPINTEVPKGLLEIKKEPIIERIIKQLHEVNIREIYIVVGFLKEQYEYLIDKYHVNLVVNSEYAFKNNMHSLKRVLPYLSNTYIVPCDIWCRYNPFSKYELYSWYMVGKEKSKESSVRINRKMELVLTDRKNTGNYMLGISYINRETASVVKKRIEELCQDPLYDNIFWEEALSQGNGMIVQGKAASVEDVIEINTYEQLRDLDSNSNHLKTDAITIISKVLQVDSKEIKNISLLKKGMTNRSFLFECLGKKYIMRIPGEGTAQLIDRNNEVEIYQKINGRDICDDIIYIDEFNGYKITTFFENSRVCNPFNATDVYKCMEKLKFVHNMKIRIRHEFKLFEQIDFYETLWGERKSVYRDYKETKMRVFSLRKYIEAHIKQKVLTHIDAVPDNFLFVKDKGEKEKVLLIDWEYAGMQDPHVDIAMFGIYSFYDKKQIDDLIQIYFEGPCADEIRIKVYCYVAVCGLLWSNWCEYKRGLGIDFGEYSLKQYRYAKEFYRVVCDELGDEKIKWDIR